ISSRSNVCPGSTKVVCPLGVLELQSLLARIISCTVGVKWTLVESDADEIEQHQSLPGSKQVSWSDTSLSPAGIATDAVRRDGSPRGLLPTETLSKNVRWDGTCTCHCQVSGESV